MSRTYFDIYQSYFWFKNSDALNEEVKKWTARKDPWRAQLKAGDRIDVLQMEIAQDEYGREEEEGHSSKQWR